MNDLMLLRHSNSTGIYMIKNKVNNKIYVGSTTQSFRKRLEYHFHCLLNNTHKNCHLQRAFNKYGEDNFSLHILEVCEKDICLEREQHYIDTLKPEYNINLEATSFFHLSDEMIKKRSDSIKKTHSEGIKYYYKVKNGSISMEDVPEEYITIVEYRLRQVPWNKGIKMHSTDHLKVPKKKKGDRTKAILTSRNKSPQVEAYDSDGNYLGCWNSSKDLEEWSSTNENNLPIKSRFKAEIRMGVPQKILKSGNINVSCNTGKPYKNIYFRFKTNNSAPTSSNISSGSGEFSESPPING